MAKPSIFSKDYEKKMKRRRIRIITTIVVVAIVSILGVLKINKKVKNLSQNNKTNINSNKNTETVKKNDAEITKKVTKKQESKYNYTLSSGEKVEIDYEVTNGNKKITGVTSSKKDLEYSINGSEKGIIIYDSKPQKIIYVDIEGNIQDISKNDYVASDGNVFTREQQLAQNPNYIWCASPKFIDDENVAYVSYLPWFNKTTQYVWIVNIKNKEHIYVQSLSGNSVKFDKVTDKGLTVIADGNTLFLKADGSVSE